MKNLKFLLPMLAFIFAIGVAFTSPELKEGPTVETLDYIKVNGTWEAVPEQNCGKGGHTCRVQFGTNGTPYALYDNMGDLVPKESSSPNPIIL